MKKTVPQRDERIANFLRRWSTVDITAENRALFEEHLMGVQALAETEEDRKLLATIHAGMNRAAFAARERSFRQNDF